MNKNIRIMLTLLGALLLGSNTSAQDCDRSCLTSHLNVYLDAVLRRRIAAEQ